MSTILYGIQLALEYKDVKLGTGLTETQLKADKLRVVREKDALVRSMIVNTAYFPLTLHWSLEKGFLNDWWVGIFGSVAAWYQIKGLWEGIEQ